MKTPNVCRIHESTESHRAYVLVAFTISENRTEPHRMGFPTCQEDRILYRTANTQQHRTEHHHNRIYNKYLQ